VGASKKGRKLGINGTGREKFVTSPCPALLAAFLIAGQKESGLREKKGQI